MRISDWSSDVCSSDLRQQREDGDRQTGQITAEQIGAERTRRQQRQDAIQARAQLPAQQRTQASTDTDGHNGKPHNVILKKLWKPALYERLESRPTSLLQRLQIRRRRQIGRATYSERGCHYTKTSVVDVLAKKTNRKTQNQ